MAVTVAGPDIGGSGWLLPLAVIAALLAAVVIVAVLRRRRAHQRWLRLWLLTPRLLGRTDEIEILRTALTGAPRLLGCRRVEVCLHPAAHRPALCVSADASDPLATDVQRPSGDVPPAERGAVSVDLVGSDRVLGVLRLTPARWRVGVHPGSVAVAFANLLSSSLGGAHVLAQERKLVEESTKRLNQDPLTTLGNRGLLSRWGDQLLRLAAARNQTAALLVLDLDNFKRINDTLGHEAGDTVLAELGRRLHQGVRQSDLAVRLGGDEFAVLATQLNNPEEAGQLAQRLLSAVSRPVTVDDVDVRVLFSAGIAVYDEDGRTIEDLLRAADRAMYASKTDGPGRPVRYAGSVEPEFASAIAPDLAEHLADGLIGRQQLVLHYQPQVELRTGKVTGFEALARWQHPELGLIPPQDFVPLAERSGLMRQLTEAVLDRALLEHGQLVDAAPGATLSVNVSARNLLGSGLVADVERLLTKHAVPPQRLTLEVAEPSPGDQDAVAEVFEALQRLGCRVSVSEYGAGPSSLTALAHYPGVREVKVNPLLVSQMAGDDSVRRLVQAIVTAGHSLGLTVVAEGVQSAGLLEQLRIGGCDVAQGFHIHPPAPAGEVVAWLERHG